MHTLQWGAVLGSSVASAGQLPAGGEARWELSGAPHGALLWLWALIVLGAVSFIVILYRRERTLGRLQRFLLAFVRTLALALVVLVLLNPRILTEIRFRRPGNTLVLLDASASMGQRDPYTPGEYAPLEDATRIPMEYKPSRSELALGALKTQNLLQRLAESNKVKLFTFGSVLKKRTKELDGPGGPGGPGIPPSGGEKETRLGDGLLQVVREAGADPISALVVISDGRSNAGPAPLEIVKDPVRWPRFQVHAVGIGKERVAKNYAVRELSAPDTVEVGYPFQLEARVRLAGLRGPTKASLYRRERDARTRRRTRKTPVEERILEPAGLFLEAQLKFVDSLPKAGSYIYSVEIPPHPDEVQRRDNRREFTVLAAEDKCRVLLVAGNPSPEYRFLRNFLLRDDGIQVSCWLASTDPGFPQDGDVVIQKMPENVEDLRPYEVVVLLDPEPESLPSGFQQGLRDFVAEEGGGLVYVAGEAHTPLIAGRRRYRAVLALLPVDLGKPSPALFRDKTYDRPWRPLLAPNGAVHPLCRLRDDLEENQTLWAVLPPFYFAHPVRAIKPAAVSLLTSPSGSPLMAVQQAGLGESVYLGSDDFWRLRALDVTLHERFWAGIIRYLCAAKKRAGTAGTVTVETDRDIYTEGDRGQLFAHLLDSGRRPVEHPRLEVWLEKVSGEGSAAPGGEARGRPAAGKGLLSAKNLSAKEKAQGISPASLERWKTVLYPVRGSPGRYAGVFRARVPGRFQVRMDSDPEVRASFQVLPVSTELDDPSPNLAVLEDLAASTGGSYFTLEDLGLLPERIPDASVTEIVGRRAETVWDSAALMLLFCGLLIVEWALRKYWNLN